MESKTIIGKKGIQKGNHRWVASRLSAGQKNVAIKPKKKPNSAK